MQHKTIARQDAERMMPLLRSIGREIRERTRTVAFLEARLAALAPTAHVHADEIQGLEAQLSAHRRELRRVEKELSRLGCNRDAENPLRILIGLDGSWAYEGGLDDTSFRRTPQDTSA